MNTTTGAGTGRGVSPARSRPRRGWLALAALLALMLAIPATTAGAATATATATQVQATATGTRGSLRNTGPIRRSYGDVATLRRIRVGRHAGFDRVVFEFAGGVPAYGVRYTPVVRLGGSGAPFPVRGTAALQVDMQASSVDMDDPSFPRTFRPLRALIPGFPTLREVRWGGEFEGLTTFAVGLTGRSGFRVLELSQPSRVVIDVAHGAIVRQLRRGDRGADVRDWQGQLNAVQFGEFATSPSPAAGPLVTDGIFGPRTARATRILQRNEGVAATGVVDAATRRALRRAFGRIAP